MEHTVEPTVPEEIQESARRQAALCRVFSNPQRILILWILVERERSVTEIARLIGSSLPSASQHLRIMELNSVVESRRERHNIFYHVAENELLKRCLVLASMPQGVQAVETPVRSGNGNQEGVPHDHR